jgi:hypothetical protein
MGGRGGLTLEGGCHCIVHQVPAALQQNPKRQVSRKRSRTMAVDAQSAFFAHAILNGRDVLSSVCSVAVPQMIETEGFTYTPTILDGSTNTAI